jgi:hypothetical protein
MIKYSWVLALLLHFHEDKRLDSEISKKRFVIQTISRVI